MKKFHRVNKDKTSNDQSQNQLWEMFASIYETQNHQWALGHPMLSMNPMLFTMSTLWIREHNRVSEELARQWPQWTDEQVYSASKKIVVGEMMGIMMNDVLNAGNSFSLKHDPDIYNGHIKYINKFTSPFELLLTTILPSGLPEEFNNTDMCSLLFTDNTYVPTRGFDSRHGHSASGRLLIVFMATRSPCLLHLHLHSCRVRLVDNRRGRETDRFVSPVLSNDDTVLLKAFDFMISCFPGKCWKAVQATWLGAWLTKKWACLLATMTVLRRSR